jgi:hypothetical protein
MARWGIKLQLSPELKDDLGKQVPISVSAQVRRCLSPRSGQMRGLASGHSDIWEPVLQQLTNQLVVGFVAWTKNSDVD